MPANLDHDQVVFMHACSHMLPCSPPSSNTLTVTEFIFFSLVCLPNRSYYRCSNPRCNAKKQVERSTEDPEMLIITYEGLHLHYAYSHFFLPRRQGNSATSLPVPKKPKIQQAQDLENPNVRPTKPGASTTQQQQQQQQQQQLVITGGKSPQGRPTKDNAQCPQGLLEDIVPLQVRKPCNSTTSTYVHPPTSSRASSPHYPSSHSWPPSSAHMDVGILSNMI